MVCRVKGVRVKGVRVRVKVNDCIEGCSVEVYDVGYRVRGQGVAALYGVVWKVNGVVWKVNGIGCWV